MTLPTSGPISMLDVIEEIDGTRTPRKISFNDADVRDLAGIPSGRIGFAELRGKSSFPKVRHFTAITNINDKTNDNNSKFRLSPDGKWLFLLDLVYDYTRSWPRLLIYSVNKNNGQLTFSSSMGMAQESFASMVGTEATLALRNWEILCDDTASVLGVVYSSAKRPADSYVSGKIWLWRRNGHSDFTRTSSTSIVGNTSHRFVGAQAAISPDGNRLYYIDMSSTNRPIMQVKELTKYDPNTNVPFAANFIASQDLTQLNPAGSGMGFYMGMTMVLHPSGYICASGYYRAPGGGSTQHAAYVYRIAGGNIETAERNAAITSQALLTRPASENSASARFPQDIAVSKNYFYALGNTGTGTGGFIYRWRPSDTSAEWFNLADNIQDSHDFALSTDYASNSIAVMKYDADFPPIVFSNGQWNHTDIEFNVVSGGTPNATSSTPSTHTFTLPDRTIARPALRVECSKDGAIMAVACKGGIYTYHK